MPPRGWQPYKERRKWGKGGDYGGFQERGKSAKGGSEMLPASPCRFSFVTDVLHAVK